MSVDKIRIDAPALVARALRSNEVLEVSVAKDLIDRIDELVRERSLLTHPFYQAWTEGALPLDSLKEYAKQYYHYESAYPTFLSGVHHRCSDRRVRRLLLDNLWDEEHGPDNHVELWLRFCDALKLDRQEVEAGGAETATAGLVDTYQRLTSSGPLAAGATALYAFESQVPEVARVKIQGLRDYYSIESESVKFFDVHRTLDLEHSDAEREMVLALAPTKADASAALDAADEATKALWSFLDGVY